ncbi:cysteine synthase A [Peptoanaerobacter stomatis]|uniref:Cysteine synthase n=1 Tax=Peptoanaerobacter stomatis TaxID=796937 RepID=G9WY82_9FIRM|nr:cysteine synthase A [Peptoanaerobacter stomatis]EHL16586.1 cysteine synthase A [Peptoanaerobacter stomatis]
MIYNNITQTIGNTPVIKLNKLNLGDNAADIYVKLEYFNPAGSIKDRAAYYMIKGLEEEGLIKKGNTIVEATSGNTGIGLALVAKALGYNALFTMPESMSIERRKLLIAHGAKLVLTPAKEGMKGAIQKAEELSTQDGYIMAKQFENNNNVKAHINTTAKEILADFDTLDAFVAGVGTGGTITGVAKGLKEHNYPTKIVAVEPKNSPILSGGQHSPHKIQGIGAGFIADITDTSLIDEIIQVSDEDAFKNVKFVSENEGILFGISSGAALQGAIEIAKKLGKGKKVLFIAPDGGNRYLSVEGLFDIN